jgi:FlaA1/EpsC-like NDP-sugar epimerase
VESRPLASRSTDVFELGRTCKELSEWGLRKRPAPYNDQPPIDLRSYPRYDCVPESLRLLHKSAKAEEVVSGRRILLTGAGGSIGSALAKAVIRLGPRILLLLDHSERNLHEIDLELATTIDRDSYKSVLGDICDAKLLSELFKRYQPEVVYHAAAFKHVPLMEHNPFAAIRNNAMGTANLARIAQAEGIASFVMVSTDKAVNPISIMGASKRLAELALLSLNNPEHRMSVVRLANVFGSQGSVVPTFLNQISQGGPVTVTHRDVSRYFLTMDEAVELILLASGLEKRGGIFIPQVGRPVKILDIAIELIKDNRTEPRKDIPVTFTGLRPGDKMAEEFFSQDESTEPTNDPRLLRVKTREIPAGIFDNQMADLSRCVDARNLPAMIEVLCQIIPEYRPTEWLSASAQGAPV